MPNILYIEFDGDPVGIPSDLNGEPVMQAGFGEVPGTSKLRIKVFCDTETPTEANMNAAWAGTIAEASSRWLISTLTLAAAGTVKEGNPANPGNVGKLKVVTAGGDTVYRANPEP